jgi:hypothetical protein
MSFDDPQQAAPKWIRPNNISLATPFSGIQIRAYAVRDGTYQAGVYLTGTRTENVAAIVDFVNRDRRYLRDNLPRGVVINAGAGWPIVLTNDKFSSDTDRRAWVIKTLSAFANVLCPRLGKWYQDTPTIER